MNKNIMSEIIEKIYYYTKTYLQLLPIFIEPYIRRIIRFIALPYCFFTMVNWEACCVPKMQVIKDFLFIFFKLKYYPDNYSACRLYEKDRNFWYYYYGSNYDPYQRSALRKIQPKEYEILFEDKEVCVQLCLGMNLPIPKTLGVVDPLTNYRDDLKKMIYANKKKDIIIKPVRGSAGKGIVKVSNNNGKILVKTKDNLIPIENFRLYERSLVQDVVFQDQSITNLSKNSINTIRVLTLLTKSQNILILGTTMRFGVGESFIDNWSAGGVAVGVNTINGTLKDTAYDKHGNQYKSHPASSIKFDGFVIPMWNDVKKLAERVQKNFYYYKLLGLDIAITTDGPVVIEINAFPDFVFQEQTSGPLLMDKRILYEFNEYNLLINKFQKKLIME